MRDNEATAKANCLKAQTKKNKHDSAADREPSSRKALNVDHIVETDRERDRGLHAASLAAHMVFERDRARRPRVASASGQ